jgi:hypothetical protein
MKFGSGRRASAADAGEPPDRFRRLRTARNGRLKVSG